VLTITAGRDASVASAPRQISVKIEGFLSVRRVLGHTGTSTAYEYRIEILGRFMTGLSNVGSNEDEGSQVTREFSILQLV